MLLHFYVKILFFHSLMPDVLKDCAIQMPKLWISLSLLLNNFTYLSLFYMSIFAFSAIDILFFLFSGLCG
jgi:hypothetical protein